MSDQRELIVSAIEATTGKPAKRHGNKIMLVCTHTDSKNYNLSVAEGNDRVLLHCFSRNCDPKDIVERAGLNIKDIYYNQLNPEQRQQQKKFINDRQLKADMYYELIVLMAWLSDCKNNVFPIDSDVDRNRVTVALKRVRKVTGYYIKTGI